MDGSLIGFDAIRKRDKGSLLKLSKTYKAENASTEPSAEQSFTIRPVDEGEVLTLEMIDEAVEKAMSLKPIDEPTYLWLDGRHWMHIDGVWTEQ
jgi:hypothetical protein